MTVSKAISLCVVLYILFALLGCAGTQGGSGWSKGKVPLGVSPEIAARADTIADFLFVAREREKSAKQLSATGLRNYTVTDSLWLLLDEARKKNANQPKPAADSAKSSNANLASNNPAEQKAPAQSRNGTIDILDRRMAIQASYNLLEARKNLEKALLLDPFKPVTKHYLALTYKLFAEKFPREVSLDRAAEQWSALTRLEPGEYLHYYNLGGVYYTQQQWQKAFFNFQRTEQILSDYAEVSNTRINNPAMPGSAAMDTTRLFDAIYLQAQSLIRVVVDKKHSGKTVEADSALAHLKRAKQRTPDPQWHALIDADIKWIHWDDRNIWGSVRRDTAFALANRGKFKEAVEIYDELLKQILQTKRAKDDVRWEYAMIAYTKLKRRATAVAWLAEVIRDIPQDSSGAPLDTTYNRMFENYGAMCYYLGLDTMKIDRRVAFQYFEQAATIAWKDRGKSYLLMADLTKTNAELSLKHAETALALADNFTVEEMKSVYRLLVDGYRRKNQMDKARFYMDKFREL